LKKSFRKNSPQKIEEEEEDDESSDDGDTMDVDVDEAYINHICTRRILGDAPAIQELSVRRGS
jgi:hypothetical protein